MKICVAGAGAIGTYLAARLSRTTADVSILARRGRAAEIRENGLFLTDEAGAEIRARVRVLDGPAEDLRPDCVFLCVKAYSVSDVIASVEPMLGADTNVVFVQNGMPWWQVPEEARDGSRLDPGGRIAAAVPMDRTVGCVTYANVRNLGPGRAHHLSDDTVILGRPDGRITPALEELGAVLRSADIDARLSEGIAREVWLKLWGSLAFNPISALTGATMDRIISGHTRPLVVAMMAEAQDVARRLGVDFGTTIEQRLAMAARAGAFKTSMLQDLEAGRPLELDSILGAVAHIARSSNVETPSIDAVLGLLRQKLDVHGLD